MCLDAGSTPADSTEAEGIQVVVFPPLFSLAETVATSVIQRNIELTLKVRLLISYIYQLPAHICFFCNELCPKFLEHCLVYFFKDIPVNLAFLCFRLIIINDNLRAIKV